MTAFPHRDPDPTAETRSSGRPRRSRRRTAPQRRRRHRWLIALGLCVALVYLLPILVSRTPLRNTVVDWLSADLNGSLHVEQLQCGWFSPVQVEGIRLDDAAGQPLLAIERVVSERSLLGLVTGTQLGKWTVTRPRGDLVLTPQGSNLEEALAAYLADDESASSELPGFEVEVSGAEFDITSVGDSRRWQVRQGTARLTTLETSSPLVLDSRFEFHHNEQAFGAVAGTFQFDPGMSVWTGDRVQIAVTQRNVPLAAIAPVIARWLPGLRSDGYVSGDVRGTAELTTGGVDLSVEKVALDRALLVYPDWLGPDQLKINKLSTSGRLSLAADGIDADQFRVESDLGRAHFHGHLDPEALVAALTTGELPASEMQLDGQLDLARLAAIAPHTLSLHDDLIVESGEVRFQASSGTERGEPRLVFNLDTANLKATRNGQPLSWQQPLRIVGTAHRSEGGLVLKDFYCGSDSLALRGSGSPRQGNFQATGDLAGLMDKVSQFVDCGGWELSGQLEGKLDWTPSADSSGAGWQMQGNLQVQPFLLRAPDGSTWQPSQLAATWKGQLLQNGTTAGIADLEGALLMGAESLSVSIRQPVANLLAPSRWQFDCRAVGDLGRWIQLVRTFVPVSDLQATGNLEATAIATWSRNQIRLNQVQYQVNPLALAYGSLQIQEPWLRGNANLQFDSLTGVCTIDNFSLRSPGVEIDTQDLEARTQPAVQLAGTVKAQGEVARLAEWIQLTGSPGALTWSGKLVGECTLQPGAEGTQNWQTAVEIRELLVASPQAAPPMRGFQNASATFRHEPIWSEKRIRGDGAGSLDADWNGVQIEDLRVAADSLAASARGRVDDLAGELILDLAGEWTPHWDFINRLAHQSAAGLARFSGERPQPIQIRGPWFGNGASDDAAMVSPTVTVLTAVGWEQANLLQLPVPAREAELRLAEGTFSMQLDELPVADGTVSLHPELDLLAPRWIIRQKAGDIVRNLNLTTDTCRSYLKYVAPWVADATSAEGVFSLRTGDLTLPLDDPAAVDVVGELELKNVTIGAGPLARQLVQLAEQVHGLLKPGSTPGDYSTWLKLDQQKIAVAVRNRRVYHQGLVLRHRDLEFQTRGSIGLDQTLDLTVRIRIPPSWVENEKWLQGLAGQYIEIPIRGALDRPRVDPETFRILSTQLAQRASGAAVKELIGKQLGVPASQASTELDRKIREETDRVSNQLQQELLKGWESLFRK